MKKFHKSSDVAKNAVVGSGTSIWNEAQIRENVVVGKNCIISKGVYIDSGCIVGNNVKIQNYASLYKQTIVEDEVFIGPYVCFSNDKHPRATTIDGKLKSEKDWESGITIVRRGASIGAGAILLPSVTISEYAMIGAGSVVTKNVDAHTLVMGNPAVIKGYVCICGDIISKGVIKPKILLCKKCQKLKKLK